MSGNPTFDQKLVVLVSSFETALTIGMLGGMDCEIAIKKTPDHVTLRHYAHEIRFDDPIPNDRRWVARNQHSKRFRK